MKLLLLCCLFLLGGQTSFANDNKFTVGITLHPYYSYVKNIVGDKGIVLPLIKTGFNPHNYSLSPADIARLNTMDAMVVNGIGHDEFAMKAIRKLNPKGLSVIYANDGIALLGRNKKNNPHTFISIDTAIRQVYNIAKSLGKLKPEYAKYFVRNAFKYAKKLRKLKLPIQNLLISHDVSQVKIASTHNAYGYLLQEFGLTVAAVVEPAHGVSPSASQLQQTIDNIKRTGIDVLFTELNMANQYTQLIEKETGIKVYNFSHMTHGEYSQALVENEMKHNLTKLVEALSFAIKKAKTRS